MAAAIAAARRGLSYVVLEKGTLVNSLLHYPTEMVFFTTPELLEIGGYPFVSPYEKPTRQEALKYYRKVADAAGLAVHFGEAATTVARRADGGFTRPAPPPGGAPGTRPAPPAPPPTGAAGLPEPVGRAGRGTP